MIEPYDQHDLDDVARLLNAELAGCSARQVANRLTQLARGPGRAAADAARHVSASSG